VPELQDIEVALTDISEQNLKMIKAILDKIVDSNKLPTKVTATTDRRKAIEGARYIMSCVRVGGLEAYADDIRIPLKYGVDQCVGDTICAGGILYGQRNIPVILDFCKDIREVAAPGAKFLNYANPMAMNTWAAIEYGKVDTVGLCHGVQHGGEQIAEILGAKDGELTSSARASTTRPGSSMCASTAARSARTNGRRLRGAPCLLAAGKAAHRRAEAVRRLFDREQRASVRIPAVVSQAARRDHQMDRHVGLDPWRDRRLSPLLDRKPQLVRDGIPALLEQAGKPIDVKKRPTNTPATFWRRWRRGVSIAATST
jgi:alpha-galactosidase